VNQYIKTITQKPYLILLLFVLLSVSYFFLAGNPVSVLSSVFTSQIWEGYYTVLIKKEVPYEPALNKAGLTQTISRQSVRFKFNGFDSFSEAPLKNLEERFETSDPRLDPYIKSIHGFFESDGEWELFYIPAHWPVFIVYSKLSTVLGGQGQAIHGQDWYMLDAYVLFGRVVTILFALLFFISLLLLRKERKYLFLHILSFCPWLTILKTGDTFLLAAFYLLYTGYFLVAEKAVDYLKQRYLYLDPGEDSLDLGELRHPYEEQLKIFGIYLGSALLFVLLLRLIIALLAWSLSGMVWKIFLPLTAGLLLPVIYGLGFLLKQKTQEHFTFLSIPIQRRGFSFPVRKKFLIAFCLILALTPFLFYLKPELPKVRIPYPLQLTGMNNITWDSLNRLWHKRADTDLPDLSTYLVHCFYQEGLMYGLDYDFPASDRKLTLTSYRENEETQKIDSQKIVVKRLDDKWLAEQLTTPAEIGIEKILLEQQRPVRVIKKTGQELWTFYPLWVYGLFFLFFIMVVFLFLSSRQMSGYVFILLGKIQTKITTKKLKTDFFSRLRNLVWIKKERKKCS
jgi:hypothetical protein